MKAGRVLLFLAVALLPIYTWSSGGMQVSHMLLVAYLLICFLKFSLRLRKRDQALAALFLFVALRESYAVVTGAPASSLMPAAYVLFTLLVFKGVNERGLQFLNPRMFALALWAASGIAVAGVLMIGYGIRVDADEGRAIGTFNNPNQLGYFSVCLASLASLFAMVRVFSARSFFVMLAAALFLAVASLSKAAMMAVSIPLVFGAFVVFRGRTFRFLAAIGMGLGIALATTLYLSGALEGLAFVRRLESIGSQSDDSFAGRGYWIFSAFDGSDVFFGKGFESVVHAVGHEVHSTIFSFFANYGALGGLLFVAFVVSWLRVVLKEFRLLGVLLLFAPPMLYGIAHNGSRFTIVWILIGLSFAFADRANRKEDSGVEVLGDVRHISVLAS